MGPVATADRDFADTVHDILERTLGALDAVQGTLFIFDNTAVRYSCVANIGFEMMAPKTTLQLSQRELHNWGQSREPRVLQAGEEPLYFGTTEPKYGASVECI